MKFNPGDIIEEKYLITSVLGAGTFGTVYLADDLFLKRKLAIKLLHGVAFKKDPSLLKRFEREAKILSGMVHANIVSVYRFCYLSDGTPLLELEYVAGESLRSLLDREGPLSCSQAANIVRQIALALKYAQSCSVVHRDLKPENVLLSKQSDKELIAKLADFGLSKQENASASTTTSSSSTLTEPGELIGTPNYMSPELCLGKGAVWQSDMYSLGCMFYEMLSGVAPFEGKNISETILNHVSKETPRLKDIPGTESLSEQLDLVISTCTAKMPEKRYASYGELLEALALPEIASNNARIRASSKPLPVTKKSRNTLLVCLAVFTPLLCWLLFSFFMVQESKNSAVVDGKSCLLRVKSDLAAGRTQEAEMLISEFLREPSCKQGELADLSMACLLEFKKAGDLNTAEICGISAIEALVDECKSRLASDTPVDKVLLGKLNDVCEFLMQNTKRRKDWSKIYSVLSLRTEVPSNQQILSSTESLNALKLWYLSALRKSAPKHETVDEMAGTVWRIYEQSKKQRVKVNLEPYLAFLREQIPKFSIIVRQAELHLFSAAYYRDIGELAKSRDELRNYEDVMKQMSLNTAPIEMDRIRELRRGLLKD